LIGHAVFAVEGVRLGWVVIARKGKNLIHAERAIRVAAWVRAAVRTLW
jgi:hypothetical protein